MRIVFSSERDQFSAEINVTNWTKLGVTWYLTKQMENNRKFRRGLWMPYYSVMGLFWPTSFLTASLKGGLAVIFVAIIRISMRSETG